MLRTKILRRVFVLARVGEVLVDEVEEPFSQFAFYVYIVWWFNLRVNYHFFNAFCVVVYRTVFRCAKAYACNPFC